MSALDELLNKSMIKRTQLEWAILVTLERGGEATAADAAQELAKKAAELAALRRVAEAARNHDLMAGPPSNRDGECYFCGGGVMHADYCDYHKWRTELNAALAEYDKCRAA